MFDLLRHRGHIPMSVERCLFTAMHWTDLYQNWYVAPVGERNVEFYAPHTEEA